MFDRGLYEFVSHLHTGQNKLIALAQRPLNKIRSRHYARADEINERSLRWLDSLDDGPFFVWIAYGYARSYGPPGKCATLYTDQTVSGRGAQSLYQRAIDNPESISDDERQLLIDLYDAEIRYNDEWIGAFIDALRERELLDESLVVVTADYGDAFGEHGYYEHPRYLYDDITHVPLLVRPPGGASRTVEAPVSTLDVSATVGRTSSTGDRTSLLDDVAEDRRVFSQARGEDEDDNLRRYAVRTADEYCLCERDRETGAIEFTDESTRSLRTELEAHVDTRARSENGDAEADGTVDGEIERRLSALGYKE